MYVIIQKFSYKSHGDRLPPPFPIKKYRGSATEGAYSIFHIYIYNSEQHPTSPNINH